jgi:hypothetical protein
MNLETGDLLLFRGNTWISKMLEYFGKSKYSHVGMIIKSTNLDLNLDPNETYILHSSFGSKPDVEDNKIKYGVQIEKLTDVLQKYSNHSIYCRMIKAERDENFYEKLKEIHKEVHRKPYDLHMKDWIKALLNLENPIPINSLYQHTDEFWCSALLSFIYFKLGWISECNWSLIAPREFSSIESTGQLLFTCIIKDEEEISLK